MVAICVATRNTSCVQLPTATLVVLPHQAVLDVVSLGFVLLLADRQCSAHLTSSMWLMHFLEASWKIMPVPLKSSWMRLPSSSECLEDGPYCQSCMTLLNNKYCTLNTDFYYVLGRTVPYLSGHTSKYRHPGLDSMHFELARPIYEGLISIEPMDERQQTHTFSSSHLHESHH